MGQEQQPLLSRHDRSAIRRRAFAETREIAQRLDAALFGDLLELAIELGSAEAALDDEEVKRVVSRRLDQLAADYA